jgi:Ca2+-binding RTX toxin-like protein
LAFTTIPGASATDATSFIGSEAVDILNSFTTLIGFVDAKESNDSITAGVAGIAGEAGLVDWTVRAGTGLDSITLDDDAIGGLFNGNQGGDRISAESVFAGARILGGQDIDTVTVNGSVVASSVNGNKAADIVGVGGGAVEALTGATEAAEAAALLNDTRILNASIYGGQGNDVMGVAAQVFESALVSGDLGNDNIQVWFNSQDIVNGLTVSGGDGNDTLLATNGLFAPTGIGTGAGIVADGGEGADLITASGRNDTITGGAGLDTINAGEGIDTITGGGDAATVIVGDGDKNTANTAVDVITDYVKANYSFQLANAGVTAGVVYETLKDALTATGLAANTNYNVGVGLSTGSYTSYLLSTDGAGAVVGGYQLSGGFTAANAVIAVTADQVTAI